MSVSTHIVTIFQSPLQRTRGANIWARGKQRGFSPGASRTLQGSDQSSHGLCPALFSYPPPLFLRSDVSYDVTGWIETLSLSCFLKQTKTNRNAVLLICAFLKHKIQTCWPTEYWMARRWTVRHGKCENVNIEMWGLMNLTDDTILKCELEESQNNE